MRDMAMLGGWRRALCGVGAVLALSACGFFGPTKRHWTEDVLLDDGSTIVAERTVTFAETDAWGSGAHNTIEQAATLAFTGDLAGLPKWSAALMPIVLYRDVARDGQWVLVAATTTCEIWTARGEPQPPYWEFRLERQGWHEVPLSTVSIDRQTNLFKGYNSLESSHVSTEQRRAYDEGLAERYLFIRGSAKSRCLPSMRRVTKRLNDGYSQFIGV